MRIRSFYSLVLIALFFTSAVVSAQNKEVRVSKKTKVFEWLNEAVVDGNQVEGGLHVYADWTEAGSGLKLAQQKVGMLVTILSENATYRLLTKSADASTAIVKSDFARLDGLVVADIAARDALTGLATGVIVGVQDNGFGEPGAFFYTGTGWIALGGSSVSGDSGTSGFIFAGQGAPSQTSGYNQTTVGEPEAIDVATDSKLAGFKAVTYTLTTGADSKPFVTYPKAWNKPTFYIDVNGTEYPLSDCWTVSYITGPDNVQYQQWTADVDFLTDATGTIKLTVR